MAWNPPSAWSVGDVSTSTKLNQLRESLIAVRDTLGLFDGSTYLTKLSQNNGAQYIVTVDGINSATPRTVLPAGSTVRGAYVEWLVTDNTTIVSASRNSYPKPGAGSADYSLHGGGVVNLRMQSNGAIEIYRASGAATWRVTFTIFAH